VMEENKKDSLNIRLTIHRKVVIGKELEFLLDTIKQEAQKNIDEKQFVQVEKEPHIQQINSTKKHNKGSKLKIVFILAGLIFLVALIALIIDDSQKKKLTSDPILMLLKSSDTITEAKFLNMSDRERQKGYKESAVYLYLYKDGEIYESTKELQERFTYDKEGNILTEIKYSITGNEYSKSVYNYNQQHMLTETIIYNSDKEISRQYTIKYHNDNTTKAEEIIKQFDGKEIKSISEIKYDDKGNPISELIYRDNKNNWSYKNNIKNIYNNENQLIETITIDYRKKFKDSEINAKVDTIIETYKYDSEGRQIVKDIEDKFNDKGQLIEHKVSDFTSINKYNKRGLVLSQTIYKADKPVRIYVYDYK